MGKTAGPMQEMWAVGKVWEGQAEDEGKHAPSMIPMSVLTCYKIYSNIGILKVK